ncbi:MAG: DUF5110 domain-containing protein, partial [Victivallaceae bacterium]
IPQQEICDAIGTETPEKIIWEIFPEEKTSFTLLEDDGESFEWKTGAVAETICECTETGDMIRIMIGARKGSYHGMPDKRIHDVKLHLSEKPSDIRGAENWDWNEQCKILTISQVKEGNQLQVELPSR